MDDLTREVSHCLTIGQRPDLLQATLESLHELRDLPTLAINDFGDVETSEVLLKMCPKGQVVGPGQHLGHHPAVDALYGHVQTPYIFHNEDDWRFSRADFLLQSMALLKADPKISVVCVRSTDDMPMSAEERAQITVHECNGVAYQRLDHLHEQWHGFTFNPHVMRKAMWEELGGYSQFKKERHVSRFLKSKGMYVAFLLPEACRHIGEGRTTLSRPPLWAYKKRFKNWLRGVSTTQK